MASLLLLLAAALPWSADAVRTQQPQMLARQSASYSTRQRTSKTVAVNRLARRNYEILEEYEAGISLVGTEVKSCRNGQMNLRDGYCAITDGECWLENVNISPHGTTGRFFNHDERRRRRLLLHKRETRKLASMVAQQGLTIVPLKAYFNSRSCLKVKIALARGKQSQDKRETIRRREQERDVRRQTKLATY
eukprot:scaffold80072_cov30-Tisochrysis_lutea.AAC.2